MEKHYTKWKKVEEEYNEYLLNNKEKVKKQIKIQNESFEFAINKFENKENKKIFADKTVNNFVISESIEELSNLIDLFLKSNKNNRSGGIKNFLNFEILIKKDEYNKYKKDKMYKVLSNNNISFITLKTIINNLNLSNNNNNKIKQIRDVAKEISNNLLILIKKEIISKKFGGFENTINKNKRTNHTRKVSEMYKRSIDILQKKGEIIDIPKLNDRTKILIGINLINLALKLNIFEIETNIKNNKTRKFLSFKKEIKENNEALELLLKNRESFFHPMVIKPKPWTDMIGGGYLNNDDLFYKNEDEFINNTNIKFIRTNNKNSIKKIRKNKMDEVYEAVNSAQNTKWKINNFVLNIINEVYENNLEKFKIIKKDTEEIPGKPFNFEENLEVKKRWIKEAHLINNKNADTLSERLTFKIKIDIINKFKNEEEIYFVHNIDFRGRLYPVNPLFSPQGDDISKSVLQFSNGKKLGKTGLKWLLIHAANVFGNDKISFKERENWSINNLDNFREIIKNPLNNNNDLLNKADKPLQFLAVINEIVEAYECKNIENYVSNIPIALDGSCSGIQHWSAILKDEIGGKGVNLLKSDKPSDIYNDVVIELKKILEEDNNSIGLMFLNSGFIDRKFTKRSVMTVPYGVKKIGIKEQILEILKEKKADKFYIEKDNINYITDKLIKAIDNVIIAARKGMKYLQNLAKIYIKNTNNNIEWTTPLGLKVIQNYYKPNVTKINTILGGTRFTTSSYEDNKNKVDIQKNTNGIAPNLIHSLDATHLMNVINSMNKNSINNFAIIHDSFGTNACDSDDAHNILIFEFYKLYNNLNFKDIIKNILNDEYEKTISELEEIPKDGNLKISDVLNSVYLFS